MTIQDYIELEWFLRNRDKIMWVTKKGDKIPITELTDEHLNNIMNMWLEKSLEQENEWYERECYYDGLGGDWQG